MPTNPLVSVVITAHNLDWCIKETIHSVLQQTYQNIEVIVVDDGSTDETRDRVAQFGDRVVSIRQRNQGWAGARNTGLRRANGNLVALLDGDDLWEPEKLATQVAAALSHPASGLIVVDGIEFHHEDGKILNESLLFPQTRGLLEFVPAQELPEGSVFTTRLCSQPVPPNFVCTPSQVMIPAAALKSVGLFDSKCQGACDYDFWVRLAARYPVTLIKKRLIRWRHHPSSSSGPSELRDFRWIRTSLLVLKKHLGGVSLENRPFVRQQIQDRICSLAEEVYYYGHRENRWWATRFMGQLLSENPTHPIVAAYLLGLWCPPWLTRWVGPTIRRLYGS